MARLPKILAQLELACSEKMQLEELNRMLVAELENESEKLRYNTIQEGSTDDSPSFSDFYT